MLKNIGREHHIKMLLREGNGSTIVHSDRKIGLSPRQWFGDINAFNDCP